MEKETWTSYHVYNGDNLYKVLKSEDAAVSFINREGYRHMSAYKMKLKDCSTGGWDGYDVIEKVELKIPTS